MKIQATPEQMGKTAEHLRSFANEYKSIREQMFSEISNLETKWQGIDNKVYTEKITEALNSLQTLINALNNEADAIDIEKQNYLAKQQDIIDGLR